VEAGVAEGVAAGGEVVAEVEDAAADAEG